MTIHEQFFNIMTMTISGVFIGAIIDALKRMREKMSPASLFRKFFVWIELFVWALLGVCTFIVLYFIKGGEWRLVDPLAQFCGIYLYEFIFSPFLLFIGKIIFLFLINPILVLLHVVKRVIWVIFKGVYSIFLIFTFPIFWIFSKVFKKSIYKKLIKVQKTVFKNE